jgi:hypothetical protein
MQLRTHCFAGAKRWDVDFSFSSFTCDKLARSSLKALVSMQKPDERVAPSHLFALVTGHGVIRQGCRIHSAIPTSGIMTASRLPLAGPTSTQARILVHLFPSQYTERRFGQMPRHGSNRFGMPLALAQPLIQPATSICVKCIITLAGKMGGAD